MSAACAWRFSGRNLVRASRSTSSARSRFSCVRASFSCARRRRLRCLPRPAASSISSRRSRGLEVTIDSTRPCEMTECISLPRPVSDSSSITSTSRQRAPASRYSPSPERSRRRTIDTSGAPRPSTPSLSSSTSSTSAALPACRPGAPPKITSCIDWPRTATGDCSPSAQRTASVTLDLPDPLGPTITLTPGPNSRRVRSGNDLKPFSVIDFRYTEAPTSFERLQGRLGRLLLGILLAAPGAASELLALNRRADGEHAIVRRALLVDHVVADERPAPSEQFLQRGLEVDLVLECVLDLRRERLDDRVGSLLV